MKDKGKDKNSSSHAAMPMVQQSFYMIVLSYMLLMYKVLEYSSTAG